MTKDEIYLQCLLEDFKAIKSEIHRRSGLQLQALIYYLTSLMVVAYNLVLASKPLLILTFIVGVWLIRYCFVIYLEREGIEISRLGSTIKVIERDFHDMTGIQKNFFVSEGRVPGMEAYSIKAAILERKFKLMSRWVLPFLVSFLGVVNALYFFCEKVLFRFFVGLSIQP